MSVKLSLVQMRHRNDTGGNVDAAVTMIRRAAAEGGQIVCLQELFASSYPCQSEDHRQFDLAQSIPGPITRQLCELAAELALVIVAPVFERRAAGLYHNSAAVIDADGSIAGVYRKMHIPDDPLYYEKFYFTPGDGPRGDNAHSGTDSNPSSAGGFEVITTRYGKLGVGICWDQWFPEAARLFALAGAEILLYPTAIGWIDSEKTEFGETQLSAWQTSIRAHAIANGLFVAAANRVGREGPLEFWGHSMICGPSGEMMAHGDGHCETIVSANCELAAIDVTRTHWPFLRDRRIDAYGGLTRRWLD